MKTISSIIALMILALVFSLSASASDLAGIVVSVSGKAKVFRAESKKLEELKFKTPIYINDRIRTDENTGLQIILGYNTMLNMGAESLVSIKDGIQIGDKEKKRGINIFVYGGTARVTVNRSLLPRDGSGSVVEDVYVQTPQGWIELKEGKNNDIAVSLPLPGKGGKK